MRNRATRALLELARQHKEVLVCTADSRNEDLTELGLEMPGQAVEYGIAESNMVASAAGAASCGKVPFLYTVTNFLSMRAYEFIRINVCHAPFNVKFIGRAAGIVTGTWGFTHHGTEDVSLLRSLPNMLVITAASPMEAYLAVKAMYECQRPAYLRVEGVNEPEIYDSSYRFEIGRGVQIRPGTEVTVISMGSIVNEALKAAERLAADDGLSVRLINMHTVKPIDRDIIIQAARETGAILTLEEHSLYGGLGGAVAEVIAESGLGVRFKMMGLTGFGRGCGNRDDLRDFNGLSAMHITTNIKALLRT